MFKKAQKRKRDSHIIPFMFLLFYNLKTFLLFLCFLRVISRQVSVDHKPLTD